MKHTYISPRTLVVKMQMEQQLMAGSVNTWKYDGENLNQTGSAISDGNYIDKNHILDNGTGSWDPNTSGTDIWDDKE